MAVKLRVEWKLLRSTRRGNIFEKWFSCDPSMRMIIVDRESAFTSIRFVFYVDVSLIEKSRDIFTVSCWNTLICLRFLSIYSWLHNCPTWLFVSSFRFAKVDFYYLVCGCFLFPFFLFFFSTHTKLFFPGSTLLHVRYKISAFFRNLCLVCRRDFRCFVSHCLRAIVHACNRFPCANRNSCRLIWINRLFRDLLVVLGRFMFSVLWQPDLFFISCLIFTRFYFIAGDVHKQ